MTRQALMLLCITCGAVGCGGSGKANLGKDVSHFVEAQKAIDAGDQEQALEHLNASIEEKPQPWTYYQRARLLYERGQEKEALQDTKDGLKIRPDHNELNWFAGELDKPKEKRFQGKFKNPPPPRK